MAKTYERCGSDVRDLIARTLKANYPELASLGMTVDAVFVSAQNADDEPVCALKRHGIPAAAQIQITPLSDRARGMADVKLTIDAYAWSRLSATSSAALIDHELQHIDRVASETDNGIDDLGRPKLKLRPHDWELAGFATVAKRHGEAAVEVIEVKRFEAEFGQLVLFPKARG